MAKKKGGGKKGGGAKKGGGEKKPKGPFVGHILDGPKPVPTEQIMVRKPAGAFLTVQVRGIVWRMMDFTERVPSTIKVFELRSMIERRHGGGVLDFVLYKETKHPRNLLSDLTAELGDLEFANSAADAERVVYYDFEPRLDDCPLLLRPPCDFKVEAMHNAEEQAKREKAEKYAARRGTLGGAQPAVVVDGA